MRIVGDCREVLPTLPKGSVQMVCTSPPYWGLRDYGVKKQIGLERTPELFIEEMVNVFRLVREVLADDGTLWVNLGDSYASTTSGTGARGGSFAKERSQWQGEPQRRDIPPGLKPKDLVGIPWRVAFALQADGWYLRSAITWCKGNPMPESIRDRPTKATEMLFLFAKASRYFYDADAIRVPAGTPNGIYPGDKNGRVKRPAPALCLPTEGGKVEQGSRNAWDWWQINSRGYPGAHFATFPPKLVEPCILAGTSERGHCPEPGCGARWVRVVEKGAAYPKIYHRGGQRAAGSAQDGAGCVRHMSGQESNAWKASHPDKLLGWRPTCDHNKKPVPDVVLDPFGGSGTTGQVAEQLGRDWVLIELSRKYAKLIDDRMRKAA